MKSNPTPKIVQNPVSEYTDTGNGKGGLSEEVPLSVRILMEKAKEYEIKQDVFVGGDGIGEKSEAFSGTFLLGKLWISSTHGFLDRCKFQMKRFFVRFLTKCMRFSYIWHVKLSRGWI